MIHKFPQIASSWARPIDFTSSSSDLKISLNIFHAIIFSHVNFLYISPAKPNRYANRYDYTYLNMGISYSNNGVREN